MELGQSPQPLPSVVEGKAPIVRYVAAGSCIQYAELLDPFCARRRCGRIISERLFYPGIEPTNRYEYDTGSERFNRVRLHLVWSSQWLKNYAISNATYYPTD